jgi:membrane-bound lytic murein transglycosylase B
MAGAWANGDTSLEAELFLPAGLTGPALLLHANFSAIRRYNPSDRYALAVALIGARLDGGQGLRELQAGLNALGHDAGALDGVVGAGTRRGLRSFQLARGLPADGFPTYAMLEEVRQAQHPRSDGRLSAAETEDLQRLLVQLGFRVGRADGVAGARTRAAIAAFERSLGRPETTGLPTSRNLAAARAFAP